MVARKITLMFTLFAIACVCASLQAGITDVTIQPSAPTEMDNISINVFGEESFHVSISDSPLTIDGTSLELDIHLQEGMMPVVTQWSHTEDVGNLSAGTYNLTVNTWIDRSPAFNDTYTTSFEVVPEPATALFLGLGLCGIRRIKSKPHGKLFIKEMAK